MSRGHGQNGQVPSSCHVCGKAPLNINYISNSQIRVMLSRKNLEEAKECLRAQPGFKFQVSICLGNSEVRSCLGGVADRVQDFLLNLNFT